MQCHLKDLAESDHDSYSFIVCERVLQLTHEIIYGEYHSASQTSSSPLAFNAKPGSSASKLPAHLKASLVGLGVVAGALGMPALTPIASDLVIKQARLGTGRQRRNDYDDESDMERGQVYHGKHLDDEEPPPSDSPEESGFEDNDSDHDVALSLDPISTLHINDDLSSSPRTSRLPPSRKNKRNLVAAAQTSPSLPLDTVLATQGSMSLDFRIKSEHQKSPHMSTPSLPLNKNASPKFQSDAMYKLDDATQTSMLRKHYLQTEVRLA